MSPEEHRLPRERLQVRRRHCNWSQRGAGEALGTDIDKLGRPLFEITNQFRKIIVVKIPKKKKTHRLLYQKEKPSKISVL